MAMWWSRFLFVFGSIVFIFFAIFGVVFLLHAKTDEDKWMAWTGIFLFSGMEAVLVIHTYLGAQTRGRVRSDIIQSAFVFPYSRAKTLLFLGLMALVAGGGYALFRYPGSTPEDRLKCYVLGIAAMAICGATFIAFIFKAFRADYLAMTSSGLVSTLGGKKFVPWDAIEDFAIYAVTAQTGHGFRGTVEMRLGLRLRAVARM